ncbi:FTR1 family iron permease [Vibrio sp. MA40-2]|uniref:FTR1 family iron permease n=1 Tax=Vibrio sp. MA40-2 TaxID=3391828 RepID=UPI0039A787DC
MDNLYLKASLIRLSKQFIVYAMLLCNMVAVSLATSTSVFAADKVNFSPAYIALSDAIGASKSGDIDAAKQNIAEVGAYLNRLAIADTANKKNVFTAISIAEQTPSVENLTALSSSLIQLENYVNPVDYASMRKQFIKRVMPTYDAMAKAIEEQDIAQLQSTFRTFNSAWAKRERVVHETSMGHYGRIETSLALLNVAKARTTLSWDEIKQQSNNLGDTLRSFNNGETIATSNSDMGLEEGIALLNTALSDYQQQHYDTGNGHILTFIKNWPVFESDVSTRAPSLYTKVENQLPLIIAANGNSKSQATLEKLITDLSALNPTANYTAMDAALILLREGLEALLIVIALFSSMQAAQQKRGQRWVVGGATAGLVTSLAFAWAFVHFLPTNIAGTTRETLEGVVGLIAVVMMLFVGLWLHGKSSAQSWKRFLQKHTTNALTAGSFFSLAALSFLAVFREGAETILFYAGILPKIEFSQFILGIVIAIGVLAVVTITILKTSVKLPTPVIFKIFTWLVYFLAFKMLGVSIHALQLTSSINIHVLNYLPTINFIGFYPTIETVIAHLVYVLIILASIYWQHKKIPQPA